MAGTDFYNNLDLSKPELAIAIQQIDRTNPGRVKFNIPVLMVGLPSTGEINKKIIQNKNNLQNENKDAIDIKNLDISNYIEISIPKELTSVVGGNYKLTGSVEQIGLSGSMGYNQDSGYFSLNGSGSTSEIVTLTPIDRYIAAGSKWVVVFIAGDINKPAIIGRYLD